MRKNVSNRTYRPFLLLLVFCVLLWQSTLPLPAATDDASYIPPEEDPATAVMEPDFQADTTVASEEPSYDSGGDLFVVFEGDDSAIQSNNPPEAKDGSLTLDLNEKSSITFSLDNGISDPDNTSDDPLAGLSLFEIRALNGIVAAVEGSTNVYIYTPDEDFLKTGGGDSLSDDIYYTVQDADGAMSNEGTITVTILITPAAGTDTSVGAGETSSGETTVAGEDDSQLDSDGDGTSDAVENVFGEMPNEAPTAQNDEALTYEGEAVLIDVLANDEDPEDDDLAIEAEINAEAGSVSVQNGQVLFTPAQGFTGNTTITYTITDVHGETDEGTVAVEVRIIPTVESVTITVPEDETIDVPVNTNANLFLGQYTYEIATGPKNGQVWHPTITGGFPGSQDSGSLISNAFQYSGVADFNGTDSFTIEVCDDNGRCGLGTITVNVTPVNDPPELEHQIIFLAHDLGNSREVSISADDILSNVSDVDDDRSSLTVSDLSSHEGSVREDGGNFILTLGETFEGGRANLYYHVTDSGGASILGVVVIYAYDFEDENAAETLTEIVNGLQDIGEQDYVEDLQGEAVVDFFEENPDLLEEIQACEGTSLLGHECDDFTEEGVLTSWDMGYDSVAVAYGISFGIQEEEGLIQEQTVGHVVMVHKVGESDFCLDDPIHEGLIAGCFTISGEDYLSRYQDFESQLESALISYSENMLVPGALDMTLVDGPHIYWGYDNAEVALQPETSVEGLPESSFPVPPFGLSQEVWDQIREVLFIGGSYDDYPPEFWQQ